MARILAAALLAAPAGGSPAAAAEPLALVLNFVASGDHAPYSHARARGWYAAAGIDLSIEPGQGSGAAVQKVGVGRNAVGIADMGSVLVGRGKGADVVAAMAIYANSPFGMYWLKSSGIAGVKDLAGKRLGAPPGDAGRIMWPAFARKAGIDPASVTMVNVAPLAKLQMLKSGGIDFTQSFYSGHAFFAKALGDDMGYLAWKDVGINPYSNALVVNGAFLAGKPDVARAFVRTTQRAFRACWEAPRPCIEALVAANSGLTVDNELETWRLTRELMDDRHFRTTALGHFDPARMAADYALVAEHFTLDRPFDVTGAYTNALLDPAIRLPD
ncbi:MAG: ABC transporter substrate-binding protein [Alphaproteobacteria bacterium]|nr:ABC transporter substrate-binding protein [Alphaproteobacteria bacterium]